MAKQRTGSIYKDKSGNWYARITFTCSNGKRKDIKRRSKTKTEANEVLKYLSRQLDDEGETAVSSLTMSFNELADYYLEHYLIPAQYVDERKICGLRDVKRAKHCLKYFREHFGNKKVREITYGDIYNYRNKRLKVRTQFKKQRTLSTIHRELSVLRRIFNIAQREGFILKNPFNCGEPLIQPSFERRRERILTIDEEKRLLEVCTGDREIKYNRKGKEITATIDNGRTYLKALIIGMLDTGARKGEMLKLTWQFVDFDNRLITFQGLTTKTLKTRQVAMTQRFYNELQSLWEHSDKKPKSLVFGIANNVRRSFISACKDAGIKHGGIDGLTLHCLRHTAATRLVKGQLPIQMIGRILGHTQPQTTYRYGLIFWAMGCFVYMFYNLLINRDSTFLIYGEVIYLVSFLLWTAGLVYLYNSSGKNFINDINPTMTMILPLWGVIAGLIYYIYWGTDPLTIKKVVDNNLIKFFLYIFFPIIDLYNLGLLITLLPSPGNEKVPINGKPLYLITAGYFFLCLASTSFTICALLPKENPYVYYNGGFTDVLFTTAFTILNFGIFYIIRKEKQLSNETYKVKKNTAQ